jgi:RHS repeat-associated protein
VVGDDPYDGSTSEFSLRTGGGRNVTLTLPGGQRTTFVFTPRFASDKAYAEWKAPPGVTATLTMMSLPNGNAIQYFGGLGLQSPYFYAGDPRTPFDAFDIPGYDLTLQDGTVYELRRDPALPNAPQVTYLGDDGRPIPVTPYSGKPKLKRIIQRTQDKIEISPASILHRDATGTTTHTILFDRDAQNRITAIRDPLAGTNGLPVVRYVYNQDTANLIQVHRLTDRTAGTYLTNKYFYDHPAFPHYITTIEDARGIPVARNLYDDYGRLTGIIDAAGKTNRFLHDTTNRVETVYDRKGVPTTFGYDSKGNITNVVNAVSTNSFTYDDTGAMLTHTDPLGNVTTCTNDANGNVLSVTRPYPQGANPANYTTRFTYDTNGNQTSVTLASGAVVTNAFNPTNGLLTASFAGSTLIFSNTFNALNLVATEADRFSTNAFAYNSAGNSIRLTNALGQVVQSAYDANGQLTSLTQTNLLGSPATSTFSYDALGRDTTADYGGGITLTNSCQSHLDWTAVDGPTIGHLERRFDDQGRLAGWTTANGATPGFAYDDNGQLQYETNSLGVVTQYSYDLAGRVTNVLNLSLNARTAYRYDAAGRRVGATDAYMNQTLFAYYPGGSLKSMTNALANVWTYSDSGGACSSCGSAITNTVTDPLLRVTETVNSIYGLPLQVIRRSSAGATNANAVTTSTTYVSGMVSPEQEAEEYPATITDEGGRVRSFGYTGIGQLQWASDLGGTKWTNVYDTANGALLSVKSPTGATLSFAYDALDNVKTVTYPDAGVLTNFYDAANRVNGVGLPSGLRVTNAFDAAGRLQTRQILSGGTPVDTAAFSHNANDTVITVSNVAGLTLNGLDAAGRLVSITCPTTASAGFQRDLLNRITTITNKASSGGTAYLTRYAYDAVGNVTNIVDPWGGNTRLEYDQVGRRTKRTLPNGFVTEWQYNWKDQVTNITHRTSGGTVRARIRYERLAGGEPSKMMRDDNGSHSYVVLGYDTALRLQSEAYYSGGTNGAGGTLGETITYSYDANGNRTKIVNAGGAFTNAITGGFRLTAVTNSGSGTVVESYAYDGGGRVTNSVRSGLNAKLGYNAADQLTQVVLTNSSTTNFAYTVDGAGRRVKATANGATERRFLVAPTVGDDLESPHLVADGSNSLKAGYVFLDGRPIVRYNASGGANNVYYLEDGMGSIIGLVDTNQASVAVFTYDGFGQTRSATGSQVAPPAGTGGDFRFHGLWLEADTGLYHARARDYDPRTGRFLSRDQHAGHFRRPETLNPYAFALNNPNIFSDPSGEFTLVEINVSGAIESSLHAFKTYAVNRAKQQAIDTVVDAFSRVAVRTMSAIFPGMGDLMEVITGGGKSFTKGARLEEHVLGAFCASVNERAGNVMRYVYLYPGIDPASGDARSSGVHCPMSGVLKLQGLVYPDFIIGEDDPTGTGQNSWLIGDVKLSGNSLYNQYHGKTGAGDKSSQFQGIINYAGKHTHTHMAVFMTFFSGERGKLSSVGRLMQRDGIQKGVIVFVFAISRNKGF